jgi:hypothetical protein
VDETQVVNHGADAPCSASRVIDRVDFDAALTML